jgi:glycosyltransferase involved in cell wall biosynthesis
MLRVGLDVSPLSLTKAGTARYLTSLLDGLEAEPEVEVSRYELTGPRRVKKLWRDAFWYRFSLARAARKDAVDVLHAPTMRAPFRSRVPLVVTVHDLAVLRRPETFNGWTRRYSAFALPRVARAADAIVVGSEFSRDEVVELLDVPPDRIRVIPYGVGPPFTPEGPAADGDYVLAVATLEPRKNLNRLVEGFRRAGLEGLELRIVGAEGWGDVRVEGAGVRWLGEVRDEELARLYRGARCVAYVSLYEGFGLPVLEAMACGTPVVAGRTGALEEVSADAAVLVDPLDADAIAAGLTEALDRRDELRKRGLERAGAFDWRDVARQTVAVYREATQA